MNCILRSLTIICAINKCNQIHLMGLQRTIINGAKVRDGKYILLLLLTITFIYFAYTAGVGTTGLIVDALVYITGHEDPDMCPSLQ